VIYVPNWCECDLRIEAKDHKNKGQIKELKAFVKHAKTGKNPLDTEKFIPYPKRFTELDKKAREEAKKGKHMKDGFNSGGYEWCNENWGTKWGICHAKEPEENYQWGELFYTFASAWSPPLPVVKKMSEMFKGLRFILTYFECGMAFNGIFICEDGKVIEDKTGAYFGNRGG
jgi:hypothetical protein